MNDLVQSEQAWATEDILGVTKKVVNNERILTFMSDGLLLGISTEYVVEIITNHTITRLPIVPPYIQGIINLRGQVIPIIDTRMKTGKPPLEDDGSTRCIIILEIDENPIGITVDSVSQVIDVDADAIANCNNNTNELISGMISLGDGVVLQMFNCSVLIR